MPRRCLAAPWPLLSSRSLTLLSCASPLFPLLFPRFLFSSLLLLLPCDLVSSVYNRANRDGIEFDNKATQVPTFDPALKTKMIVHGFIHSSKIKPLMLIKDEFLNLEPMNVIITDWSRGNGFPYTQATANTQIVGAEMANLVNRLIQNQNAQLKDFHLIGHSLGSHICGYAGSRLPGLPRITGLDPAGPYFGGTDPIVRLDPKDALFVDTIHTDAEPLLQGLTLGLGLMQPLGHADFYPNGGNRMPNCPATSDKLLGALLNLAVFNVDGIENAVACSHNAAYYYFADSINKCKFTAFNCDNKDSFDKAECLKCSADKGCNQMGYWASPSRDQGMLFTNARSPLDSTYCLQNFRVDLKSGAKGLLQARGKFTISLKTSTKTSKAIVFEDSDITFKPDSTQTRLVSLEDSLGNAQIQSVFVSYTKTSNFFSGWLYDDSWSFTSIQVLSGDNQTNQKFCPTKDLVASTPVEFKPC